MQPLAIIEPFNKREDLSARLIPGVIGLMMHQFIFQRAEEAFRHRIIITVALPAHARCHAEGGEPPLIGQAAVLGTLIGVMNEARSNASLAHRHGESLQRQVLVGLRTHGPADHPSRIQIQEHRHIEPADSRRDMGEIPDPHAIQRRGHKALPQYIGSGGRELMVLDDDPEPTDAPGFEPCELPEPGHAVATTLNPACLHRPP